MTPRSRDLLSALALCGLAGCGTDIQSVLVPSGTQAAQITTLTWGLFGFTAVVLVMVIVATWFAVRGPPRIRAALADERTIIVLGLAFPAIALSMLLGYSIFLMRTQVTDAGDTIKIEVLGERWWWRVTYAGSDGRPIASANEIRVPVGRPVTFTLKSSDVIHSFWVPSLGGKVDMIPGRTTRLRLTAEQPGVYRGQCAEYCGVAHALMAFTVTAMPAEEYDDWLTREAMPALAPSTNQEHRGAQLFIAAGCGACHAVRGTPAKGTIGPDLSHVGGRRAVGIDTLPLTATAIARFITEGQHIKPGNTMPEFRNLAADDVAAIAAYLLNLR